jgi:hypothetical protein
MRYKHEKGKNWNPVTGLQLMIQCAAEYIQDDDNKIAYGGDAKSETGQAKACVVTGVTSLKRSDLPAVKPPGQTSISATGVAR